MSPMHESDLEDRFNNFLDEVYGQISICGLEYSASMALQDVDPTAYRCGFNDWLDGEISNGSIFERDGEYYDEDPSELDEELTE